MLTWREGTCNCTSGREKKKKKKSKKFINFNYLVVSGGRRSIERIFLSRSGCLHQNSKWPWNLHGALETQNQFAAWLTLSMEFMRRGGIFFVAQSLVGRLNQRRRRLLLQIRIFSSLPQLKIQLKAVFVYSKRFSNRAPQSETFISIEIRSFSSSPSPENGWCVVWRTVAENEISKTYLKRPLLPYTA